MNSQPKGKFMVTVIVVIFICIVGYYVLTAPDRRSPGEKIGDAINELEDRTPAERINDSMKDK